MSGYYHRTMSGDFVESDNLVDARGRYLAKGLQVFNATLQQQGIITIVLPSEGLLLVSTSSGDNYWQSGDCLAIN